MKEKITKNYISSIIKKRNPISHKGDYGHALIIAGSYGKIGAAVLNAKACLKTGVGLLTIHIPKCGYEILQSTIPEAMVSCDDQFKIISKSIILDHFNAIGIGSGIGTASETANVVKEILTIYKNPMVIDADAINIISQNKSWLKLIPKNSIFTPHLKEFERLVGIGKNELEIDNLQIEFSKKYSVYTVLKGHHTCISTPNGKCFINTTGNAGMAKGGTGDSLTGMLTSLLAQGYSSKDASIAAVYLHGLAGDIASVKTGEYSLLASDLIDCIGNAFLSILEQ